MASSGSRYRQNDDRDAKKDFHDLVMEMNEQGDIPEFPDLPQILFVTPFRNFQKNDSIARDPSATGKQLARGFLVSSPIDPASSMMTDTSSTALRSNPGEFERYGKVTAPCGRGRANTLP